MRYSIHHTTVYTYLEPVSLCHNVLRLAPRNTGRQVCESVSVKIHPEPDNLREYEDFFGNKVIYFSIEKAHAQLTVNVHSEIEKKAADEWAKHTLHRGIVNATVEHISEPRAGCEGQGNGDEDGGSQPLLS